MSWSAWLASNKQHNEQRERNTSTLRTSQSGHIVFSGQTHGVEGVTHGAALLIRDSFYPRLKNIFRFHLVKNLSFLLSVSWALFFITCSDEIWHLDIIILTFQDNAMAFYRLNAMTELIVTALDSVYLTITWFLLLFKSSHLTHQVKGQ